MFSRLTLPIITLSILISGCTTVATGTAEVTGLSLLHDRRTSEQILMDERIELGINSKISKQPDLDDKSHINITSYNGTVLLTGEAQDEAIKSRIIETARTTAGVKLVHTYIDIEFPSTLSVRTKDTLISGKVKSALSKIRNIPGFDATRVKVVTEKSTVYLMGLIHKNEADISVATAQKVPGVRKVVSVFEFIE